MDASEFRRSVRSLVRALGVLYDTRTPCGSALSVREAYALAAIDAAEAAGTPLSQSELQDALGVDKSNVTRLVQQLVAAGRAEQRTQDEDGRVRRLQLTAKGRRLTRKVDEQSLQRFSLVLGHIPARERRAVHRALETLCNALDHGTGAET
jgi:DNA-binding MarR family transcriptional regulator